MSLLIGVVLAVIALVAICVITIAVFTWHRRP